MPASNVSASFPPEFDSSSRLRASYGAAELPCLVGSTLIAFNCMDLTLRLYTLLLTFGYSTGICPTRYLKVIYLCLIECHGRLVHFLCVFFKLFPESVHFRKHFVSSSWTTVLGFAFYWHHCNIRWDFAGLCWLFC